MPIFSVFPLNNLKIQMIAQFGKYIKLGGIRFISPPTVNQLSLSQIVATESTITLSAISYGSQPISYQWYKNSVLMSGRTNNTLVLSNISTTDTATYYCVLSNYRYTVTSDNINISVLNKISILSQTITALSAAQNSLVTLTVSASGDNITYGWYKDGVSLLFGTASSYNIYPAQTLNNGAYYCILSSEVSLLSTNTINLSVI